MQTIEGKIVHSNRGKTSGVSVSVLIFWWSRILSTLAAAQRAPETGVPRGRATLSLNGTGGLRKDRIRIRPDQPHCADDENENDSEHYGIFGDVLALFVAEKLR